jgi:hypothetical protein
MGTYQRSSSSTHFFTQIPHPIHSSSEMTAFLSVGLTSIQSFPILTTGHVRLHSCLHFLGLHLSLDTIAIRVSLSLIVGRCIGVYRF